MRDTVLIVDDIPVNRIILREILQEDYLIWEAEDGLEALRKLSESENLPQAVLLDIQMPGMNGFEVLQQMKSVSRTAEIPVLIITALDIMENESRGLRAGAADYISKPFNPDVVKVRVDQQVQLMRYRLNLESLVKKKTMELERTHETILETLATIIEYRSLESGTHVRRTCELTRLMTEAMLEDPVYRGQLEAIQYQSAIKAVSLHDVGKIGIPDSVLLKNGPLTTEEFDLVKTHTIIGAKLIDDIAKSVSDDALYLRHCKDICRHHHERWDGRGYPDGLAGEAIPLSARIVSVIDVYDALVNQRCYKPAFSHEEALGMIRRGGGSQFDPGIVAQLDKTEKAFQKLEKDMADPE